MSTQMQKTKGGYADVDHTTSGWMCEKKSKPSYILNFFAFFATNSLFNFSRFWSCSSCSSVLSSSAAEGCFCVTVSAGRQQTTSHHTKCTLCMSVLHHHMIMTCVEVYFGIFRAHAGIHRSLDGGLQLGYRHSPGRIVTAQQFLCTA